MTEEVKLELLPSSGLVTLEQLAHFLEVETLTLRTNLEKKGIKMLPYYRGRFIISLEALNRYLLE